MKINQQIFKAYDVRGVYPDEINEAAATAIGRAYARWRQPKTVMVGRDVRLSSPALKQALISGLTDAGVKVTDIGLISTDMLYYAVATGGADGGITVTASHNPRKYNGLKFVREQAIAVSSDTGLQEIARLAAADVPEDAATAAPSPGAVTKKDIRAGYLEHVCSFIDPANLRPLKVVVNGNFGLAAGVIAEALAGTPVQLIPLNDQPDGNFPKGRPDPLIPENRAETTALIIKEKADLGIAWDADADRCFFFDENGEFVDGYFMTAILAALMLARHPGEKIIHDPRLTWAVIDTVTAAGGTPLMNKAGHTFIKDRLRQENAVFAGEMSAHYYFRDNFYCDNGMIPALLILEQLSTAQTRLSDLARPYRDKYFISGEINNEVADGDALLAKIKQRYGDAQQDETDGLSIEYKDWRGNVRLSNTEPVVRLNVEARDQTTMEQKRDELLTLIKA